jgi:hypothetical protein
LLFGQSSCFPFLLCYLTFAPVAHHHRRHVARHAPSIEPGAALMRLNPKGHGYRELFEATEQILQEMRGRLGRLQLAGQSGVGLG